MNKKCVAIFFRLSPFAFRLSPLSGLRLKKFHQRNFFRLIFGLRKFDGAFLFRFKYRER